MVAIKHKLLGHLGLEHAARAAAGERSGGVTVGFRSAAWIVSLVVFAALAIVWEILSFVYTVEAQPGEPMVAGWGTLFTRTSAQPVRLLAGRIGRARGRRWRGAQLSRGAALGHLAFARDALLGWRAASCSAAFLASRLALRFPGRPGAAGSFNCPTQFLRALPLLAMVPLFQLWFGTYFFGQVLFVSYGVGVIVFAGVVNAVRNVPQIYHRQRPGRSAPRDPSSTEP